jgi:putative FmdB family regulatory protein
MPIYEYKCVSKAHCEYCAEGFELLQKISEATLSACTKCGAPVQRIISAPSLSKQDVSLDRSNLEKHGFTQYKKAGKGVYEKTAGKGPNVLNDD